MSRFFHKIHIWQFSIHLASVIAHVSANASVSATAIAHVVATASASASVHLGATPTVMALACDCALISTSVTAKLVPC